MKTERSCIRPYIAYTDMCAKSDMCTCQSILTVNYAYKLPGMKVRETTCRLIMVYHIPVAVFLLR